MIAHLPIKSQKLKLLPFGVIKVWSDYQDSLLYGTVIVESADGFHFQTGCPIIYRTNVLTKEILNAIELCLS